MADGGEGTVAAAVRAGWSPRSVRVAGPDGGPVTATFALRDGTAVVELATAAGFAAAHAMTEVEPDVQPCLREPAAVLADLAASALGGHPS